MSDKIQTKKSWTVYLIQFVVFSGTLLLIDCFIEKSPFLLSLLKDVLSGLFFVLLMWLYDRRVEKSRK